MKRLNKSRRDHTGEDFSLMGRTPSRVQSLIQLPEETASQSGRMTAEKEKEKPVTAYVS